MDRESGVIAVEFQGAEYRVVVIVLLKDHYLLLHRQLLHTAVTRAKQACVLVADRKTIGMAVRNSQPTMRNSGAE